MFIFRRASSHHLLDAVGGGGVEDWLLKAPLPTPGMTAWLPTALLPIPTETKLAAPAEERLTSVS